jgi:hypothetical protein
MEIINICVKLKHKFLPTCHMVHCLSFSFFVNAQMINCINFELTDAEAFANKTLKVKKVTEYEISPNTKSLYMFVLRYSSYWGH